MRTSLPSRVYQTSDGYLYMAVGSDRQWAALVALPSFAALSRPDYERNAGRIAAGETLHRELGVRLRGLTTAEALELLRGAGIPVSPVQTMAEVLKDPLVAPELVHVTDPRSGMAVVLPAPPVEAPVPLGFPPRLGEHNERVYGSALGLGAAKRAGPRAARHHLTASRGGRGMSAPDRRRPERSLRVDVDLAVAVVSLTRPPAP